MPTDLDRVDPKLLELARQVSTATFTSQLQKRGFANTFMYGVVALRPDLRLAGQPCTLRYIRARNDLLGLEATFRRLRSALVELGEGDDPDRVLIPPTLKRVFNEVRALLIAGRD